MTRRKLSVVFLLLCGIPCPSSAQPAHVRAAVDGEIVEVPGLDLKAELVTLGAEVASVLRATSLGEEILVSDWPTRPGERADFVLRRRDVYAPAARIWEVTSFGRFEVPRSPLLFYWGSAERTEDLRLLVTLDPRDESFRGVAWTPDGLYETRPVPEGWKAGPGRHLVGPQELFVGEDEREALRSRECSQSGIDPGLAAVQGALGSRASSAISTLHTAEIAVETDNELMSLKFGNDTGDASDYLAELFAGMNVIYERDLLVRLLQGTTFLRTSPDPYDEVSTLTCTDGMDVPQVNCPATSAQLAEFDTEWTNNHGGVVRALAMMLSGKQGSNNSASGIARVDALCSESNGYSFSQVFKFNGSTAAHDVSLVAHELGHNFGSVHTHCYSPPVDQCRSGEGGPMSECFQGTPSCPAPQTINTVPNVRGTLMSYCHLLGGCSASDVFHPTVTDFLDPLIEHEVGDCILPDCDDATIRVRKATIPAAAGTSFDFTGDLIGSIPDGGQIEDTVPADTYTVTESLETGWILIGIQCDDANSTGNVGTLTATFQADCGETVTCTFVNCQDTVGLDVTVPDQDISNTQTFEACDTLTAADVDVLAPGGDVTFLAGGSIVLESGFSVAAGASFRAVIAGE